MGCISFSDLLQQVARCRVGRADYGTSRWVVATLLLPFLNVLARLKVEMSERRQCNNTVCVSHLDKIMNCYVVKRGPNFPSSLWAMPQRKLFVDGGVPLYLKILFKTTQWRRNIEIEWTSAATTFLLTKLQKTYSNDFDLSGRGFTGKELLGKTVKITIWQAEAS